MCHGWGFKRKGLKQIRGCASKIALLLGFPHGPGAVGALRKRAKRAEKKKASKGPFQGKEARHALNNLRQPETRLSRRLPRDRGQELARELRQDLHERFCDCDPVLGLLDASKKF